MNRAIKKGIPGTDKPAPQPPDFGALPVQQSDNVVYKSSKVVVAVSQPNLTKPSDSDVPNQQQTSRVG